MSGLYQQFKTSSEYETKGVIIDYGSCRITIARSGGSNKRYNKVLDNKTKPFRRLIQTQSFPLERLQDLIKETIAECVILKWETKVEDEFKVGIEGEDGTLLPFTYDNVLKTLNNLPDLFADIQLQAQQASLFKEVEQEEDLKN